MSIDTIGITSGDEVEVIAREGLHVSKSSQSGTMRFHVRGHETFANTIMYWRAILEELQAGRFERLLLVDELKGTPLLEREWLELVVMMEGLGLDKVRIAHVKPNGLNEVEFCEIYARDSGIDARVFLHEHEAISWLHA